MRMACRGRQGKSGWRLGARSSKPRRCSFSSSAFGAWRLDQGLVVGAALAVDQSTAISNSRACSPFSQVSSGVTRRNRSPRRARSSSRYCPLFLRLKLFGDSYPIEITLIQDNPILLNAYNGSPLQVHGWSGRFTAVGSLAGIGALHSPMMSDQPRLNFTSIEQLDMKVGKKLPTVLLRMRQELLR